MEQQQESSTTTLTKGQEEELSSILDLAEQSIEKFVEEQSSLLDLLSKEIHEYATPVMTGDTTDIVATTQEDAMDIALSGFEGDSG